LAFEVQDEAVIAHVDRKPDSLVVPGSLVEQSAKEPETSVHLLANEPAVGIDVDAVARFGQMADRHFHAVPAFGQIDPERERLDALDAVVPEIVRDLVKEMDRIGVPPVGSARCRFRGGVIVRRAGRPSVTALSGIGSRRAGAGIPFSDGRTGRAEVKTVLARRVDR
jgi:hypothetical protein